MMAKCTHLFTSSLSVGGCSINIQPDHHIRQWTHRHLKISSFEDYERKLRDLEQQLQLSTIVEGRDDKKVTNNDEHDFNKFPSACRMRNVYDLHFKCLFPCA